MTTKKLTDLFVERVTAPARGRAEYFDASFPGLALRVSDRGARPGPCSIGLMVASAGSR